MCMGGCRLDTTIVPTRMGPTCMYVCSCTAIPWTGGEPPLDRSMTTLLVVSLSFSILRPHGPIDIIRRIYVHTRWSLCIIYNDGQSTASSDGTLMMLYVPSEYCMISHRWVLQGWMRIFGWCEGVPFTAYFEYTPKGAVLVHSPRAYHINPQQNSTIPLPVKK